MHACQAASRRAPARRPRRGVACVLAMLFLVLMATMALGFYAIATMAPQVAANEDRVFTSRLAAESGMEFVRFQLASIELPPTTPPDKVYDEVYNQLSDRLDGTLNMGGGVVGYPRNPARRSSASAQAPSSADSGGSGGTE